MADYSNDDRDMSSAGFGLTMTKEQTQGQVLDSGGTFVCSMSAIYLFILQKYICLYLYIQYI